MTPSLMILVAPFAVGFPRVHQHRRRHRPLRRAAVLFRAVHVRRGGAEGVPPRHHVSPAWWAIGFPIAALVNAALRYAELRASLPLWVIAIALLGLLSLAMAVLTVRTLRIAFNGKLLA
jgi:tellurite resistance protein